MFKAATRGADQKGRAGSAGAAVQPTVVVREDTGLAAEIGSRP